MRNKIYVSDLPELLKDWHSTKNLNLSPFKLTAGSVQKVWWKCHKCGYEWQATIVNRSRGRGCSYCSKKIVIKGVNDLATLNPRAASEWDYEKNYPNTPDNVFNSSNKKYWFKCVLGHGWQTTLNSRNKNNCPYCGNQKLLVGFNDLETTNLSLCTEWNYEKNYPLTPQDVMKYSNKKVWWKCKTCGHEWYTSISSRSRGGGCPKCKNDYKVSESERIIYFYIKKFFADAIISYHPKWLNNRELDIFIPSIKLGIEYDGGVWHKNVAKDIDKTNIIISHGIDLVRIRENNCPSIEDESFKIIAEALNYQYSRLNPVIVDLFEYINMKYNLSIVVDVDVERDYQDILSLTAIDKAEKSLLHNYPDLSKEWDYEKNKLTPDNVQPGSNKKVWWKCKTCGHEWKAIVANRVKGKNCPLCSNKRIIVGHNDLLTINPILAEEWNYEKNYPLTPQDVTYGSNKRVWWKCKTCGHEWATKIPNRKYNNCPQCAIQIRINSNRKNRVIKGINDLASQFPNICNEWDYEKNISLKPEEIYMNSNMVVWWKCREGHEWQTSIISRTKYNNKCPYCENNKTLEGYNDFLSQFPTLCEEWNYEKNIIKPDQITKRYSKNVWWKCKTCGHEWQATINSRIKGSGCTICAVSQRMETRNKNLLENRRSLFEVNPNAAEEWNYEKNYPLTPHEVTPSSGKKVWWKCKTCGHEWQATISHVNNGTRCKKCATKTISEKKRKR